MSNIKTGGPAFPRAASSTANGFSSGADGMTLRDYFAAKAMHAQMLNHEEMGYWSEEYSVDEAIQFCADMAYRMADAMLKAREQS